MIRSLTELTAYARVAKWLACAVILMCCGCGGSDREASVVDDTDHDLAGYWSPLGDVECVGIADQAEVEALLAALGALDDGFHGADRLTIRQDGQAFVFEVEGHVPRSASLEDDDILIDFSICTIADADSLPYDEVCFDQAGLVLEEGGVIEIIESYELAGYMRESGKRTLTCTHRWEWHSDLAGAG